MGDGMWHTIVPITDEHVFLHLLRAVYFHQKNINMKADCFHRQRIPYYNATLFAECLIEMGRVPSPYIKVYKKKPAWWRRSRWYVEITKLGIFYCNYVYTYVDRLDCEKSSHFYTRDKDGLLNNKIPNAAARFRERLPLILYKYGFSSRADYLVKWSIFKGALGYHDAPLSFGQTLGMFDHNSEGIPTKKEADRTVCMSVEELI